LAGRGSEPAGVRSPNPGGRLGRVVPARIGADHGRRVERQRSSARRARVEAPGAGSGARRAVSAAPDGASPKPRRRVRGEHDRGRLFGAMRAADGDLSDSVYGRVWSGARVAGLTPAEAASPLARRPYDLRHAAVSTWLNAGVPPTQVAEWAGHSLAVLLRVYAKCIAGQEDAARRRVAVCSRPARVITRTSAPLRHNHPHSSGHNRTPPDT
jgi:integrase